MIRQWSFSRLKDFELCPAYAYYAHSKDSAYRDLRTFGPAAERGTRVHTAGEQYLKGEKKRLPSEWSDFRTDMKDILKAGAVSEERWAFDRRWRMLDNYYDSAVWGRVVIDARIPTDGNGCHIIDFKTGKVREDDHVDQMRLYSIATLKLMPNIDRVTWSVWYLDQNEQLDCEDPIERKTALPVQVDFEKRIQKMTKAKKFPAKPSWKCKWCDFAKSKGGPCTKEKK